MVVFLNFSSFTNSMLLWHLIQNKDTMKDAISQVQEWIKLVPQGGIGLIALGIVVEIVFGKGAIFGASVIQNLSQIVAEIGGENGFIGLVAIFLILAIFQKNQ